MRTYEIIKYVGGYVAALGGVDAIVFTAGIGKTGCAATGGAGGLRLSGTEGGCGAQRRARPGSGGHHGGSAVRAFVIPTNEELVIARDTRAIVEA